MPWDDDEDEDTPQLDWLKAHLEQRISIYRDMQNNTLNEREVYYIKVLLKKISTLNEKIEILEEGSYLSDSVFMLEEEDETKCELIDLRSQLRECKLEFEALENPFTRKIYLLKKLQQISEGLNPKLRNVVFVVWLGGSSDELLNLLYKTKELIEKDAFVRPASLTEAIQEATAGDTIVLCPGVHLISEYGKFLKDCKIKGCLLESEEDTCILACGQQNDTLLDWNGQSLHLEDVVLNEDQVRALAIVHRGILKLRNCVLKAGLSSNTDGLLVPGGAIVELDNCKFIGLETAIVASPGAVVTMNNCEINLCKFGIQASEKSHLSLMNCSVSKCKKYGIKIQRTKKAVDLQDEEVGSLELLAEFHTFNLTNCIVQGNTKGDVLLIPQDSCPSDEFLESSSSTECESENTSSGTIVLS